MTGRGMGYCTGRVGRVPYGIGWGYGAGWGRGWRNRFYATGVPGWAWSGYGRGYGIGWRYGYAPGLTPQEEIDLLNAEAKDLERELEDIRRRMEDLKNAPSGQDSTND